MIIGTEVDFQSKMLVTSYCDAAGKINFVCKRLAPSDLYVWIQSREQTQHLGWDGRSLRKMEVTDSVNRFRVEELMLDKFTPEDWAFVNNAYTEPRAYAWDIETQVGDNNEFPDPTVARYPINLMSLVPEFDTHVRVLTTLCDLSQEQKDRMMREVNEYFAQFGETYTLSFLSFSAEDQMLTYFAHEMLPKISLLYGWNVIEFDWQTFVNRCDQLKVDIVRHMPSKNLTGPFRMPVHMGMIDYIEAMQKFRPMKAMENHQLDYVAKRSVGIGKLKNPYKSFKAFQEDPYTFIKYNIIDSILPRLIEKKHRLLRASYAISNISGVELNRIFGPVFMTEMLMCKIFLLDGRHLWSARKAKNAAAEEKYKGAYVMKPIPGFYELIACFDFSSMYPNIQMQFNMSPDTFLGLVGEINTALLRPGSFAITKNDTVFSLDRDSVARRILANLYGKRSDARKEIDQLKELLEKNARAA